MTAVYPGEVRRAGRVAHATISLTTWPLVIVFSPVVVLVGEPVNRYVMRRVRRKASTAQAAIRLSLHSSLLLIVISNPLWIALTAPGRWVTDRFRKRPDGSADR